MLWLADACGPKGDSAAAVSDRFRGIRDLDWSDVSLLWQSNFRLMRMRFLPQVKGAGPFNADLPVPRRKGTLVIPKGSHTTRQTPQKRSGPRQHWRNPRPWPRAGRALSRRNQPLPRSAC